MEWRPDWGLRIRMIATLALVLSTYLVLAFGIVSFTHGAGTIVFGLLALGFGGVHYWYADRLLHRWLAATPVEPAAYPDLHATVDRLARQAALPKPTIAVVDSPVPNAFVTGLSRDTAVLTVTTGLLETLEERELEAVLAHELAHVNNRDAIVLTIASFPSTVARMVLVAGGLAVGGREGSHTVPAGVLVLVPIAVPVSIVGDALVRLLSRHREFAADRGAVAITGDPSALAGALATLSDELDRVAETDLRGAELNAFFVVPLDAGFDGRILGTHPPVERRIERLRRLERQLS